MEKSKPFTVGRCPQSLAVFIAESLAQEELPITVPDTTGTMELMWRSHVLNYVPILLKPCPSMPEVLRQIDKEYGRAQADMVARMYEAEGLK